METSLLEQDLAPPELEEFLEGEEYAYHYPQRGDIRKGVILSIGPEEIVVNIGLKREGIVPSSDLERLGEEAISGLEVGDEVPVFILKSRDQEGNVIVSLHRARLEQDWLDAQELFASGEVWEGVVSGYNRGGVVVIRTGLTDHRLSTPLAPGSEGIQTGWDGGSKAPPPSHRS